MKKKRIAFILGSMGQGGAEKVVSVLSRDYAEKGWDTDILVLLFNNVDYELHPTTRVIDCTGKTQSRLKRLPYWLKAIREYAKANKPDVVLSFVARINIISQIACRSIVPRFYVSERNDPRCDGRSKFVDVATKILYSKADGVVFQTQRAMSYFPKLKNGTIISNPISVTTVARKLKTKKIVTIGRLAVQKNHRMLINAFSEVCKKYSEYILEIYGGGELKDALQEQIHSLGLDNKVYLMGNRSDIHECIADAEMFVLSSDYEGLSNALLEALTMGLPCISTNCAGSDEYIIDGYNGLLTQTGDVQAMADTICCMIENDELREICGANAAKTSKKYRKDNVLKKWHDFIG